MRLKTICLSIGLLCLSPGPVVQAADWNSGGGIKDYRAAGVPVPAPIPYPETFKWYLRADVGLGLSSEPAVSEKGMTYGLDRDPAEGSSFGLGSSWFSTDFDTFAVGGIGAGAYLTPRLRADFTVDARTKSAVAADTTYSYTMDPAIAANTRVDGHVIDHTDVRSTVMLANLYWDLVDRSNRFVPYVGFGIGAAVRTMEREHRTTESLVDTVALTSTPGGSFSGQGKAHQLAPAAAAMAGIAYTISNGIVVDLNYRYTYIGEADFSSTIGFNPARQGATSALSRLTVGDTHEHTLRAGMRWNIW